MILKLGISDTHTCDSFSQNSSFELLAAFRGLSGKGMLVSRALPHSYLSRRVHTMHKMAGQQEHNISGTCIDSCVTLRKDTTAQASLAEIPAETVEKYFMLKCSTYFSIFELILSLSKNLCFRWSTIRHALSWSWKLSEMSSGFEQLVQAPLCKVFINIVQIYFLGLYTKHTGCVSKYQVPVPNRAK